MRYNCSIIDLYDRSIVTTLNSVYQYGIGNFREGTDGRKALKKD